MDYSCKVSIIVPVYNVEQFLAESLDSLAAQTIDKEEMEVLMIDDGSPDDSISIMQAYAEKYPYMKILRKENEGLSMTRNYGLRHATGKYIMYLDSDDTISPETVKSVTDFFDEHYDEVDLVCYYMVPVKSGELSEPHYRFEHMNQTGIYDLRDIENAYITQTNINICVKNLGEDNLLFDTDRTFRQEDQKYCTKILQPKMKIGYCAEGTYFYRQQGHSTIHSYFYAYYLFETSMLFWEELFGEYENEEVPYYIQALYINDVKWKHHADLLLPYHYSDEEFAKAKERVLRLLEMVDDEVILNHPAINDYHKHYYINIKRDKEISVLPEPEEIRVLNKGKEVFSTDRFNILVTKFKPSGDQVRIAGILRSPGFIYMDDPELFIAGDRTLSDGRKVDTRLSSHSYYRMKNISTRAWYFELDEPVSDGMQFAFFVKYGEHIYPTDFTYHSSVAFRAKKRETIVRGEHQYRADGQCFYVSKAEPVPQEPPKPAEPAGKQGFMAKLLGGKKQKKQQPKLGFRDSVKAELAKGDSIWLYYDCRGYKKDNGFFQFAHDFGQNDNVRRYYIVNEEDEVFAARKKEYPEEMQGNIIQFGTWEHKRLFLACELLITAFIERENYNPFEKKDHKKYLDMVDYPEIVYLQHGVLHAHVPWKYSYDRMFIEKEVISTAFEEKNLTENYCFSEENLIKAGMPRYDFIDRHAPSKNRILFAPSWRRYLLYEEEGVRHMTDQKFMDSVFFKETQKFLNSRELEKALEEKDLYLDFKLHPIFAAYEGLYSIDNERVRMVSGKIEEADYKLFMTDFSSYVFDFVYLGRAIMYFMPDYEMFKSGMNFYRQLDIPLEEGFGPLAITAEEAVEAVTGFIARDFEPEEQYADRMNGMFFYDDANQRDRIYSALLEMTGRDSKES